jgi:gluconokinase
MVVVVMGPSGAGKSTVGAALADALGWRFVDADDLHSAEHIAQMHQGIPLTDETRGPWLERVHGVIAAAAARGEPLVVACSALKESYRTALARGVAGVTFVFLDAPADLLRSRISARPGHFMPATLVDSQLATLEPPADAVRIDARQPVAAQIAAIRHRLRL